MELNDLLVGLNKIKKNLNITGKFKRYASVDLSPKVPSCHYEERKTLQEVDRTPYGDCGNNIIHSDPRLKRNVEPIDDYDALSKLRRFKFFKYDYLKIPALPPFLRGTHVEIGTLTTHLPRELIRDADKLGGCVGYDLIDVNAYINFLAKAIQQLDEKVDSIKEQKESSSKPNEMDTLKDIIADLDRDLKRFNPLIGKET